MKHGRAVRSASLLLALAAGAACVAPQRSWEEGTTTPATPQRPTIARNTAVVPQGTVEVEAGMERAPGQSFNTPVLLKYGLRRDGEGFVQFSPYRAVEYAGEDGEGFGDVVLGWRQHLSDQAHDRPALAWQAKVKVPTASAEEGLGTEEPDFFAGVIASLALRDWSASGFAQLGALNEPGSSGMDLQETLAVAIDRTLGSGIGVFGELGGIFVPEHEVSAVLATVGATWSPTPGLVLDSGLRIGLSDDAPDFQWLIGFTRNLGRISGWSMRVPSRH